MNMNAEAYLFSNARQWPELAADLRNMVIDAMHAPGMGDAHRLRLRVECDGSLLRYADPAPAAMVELALWLRANGIHLYVAIPVHRKPSHRAWLEPQTTRRAHV